MFPDAELHKLWLATGKAFVISLVLTPIARDVFRAYNLVDRPGRRKVHAYPIPRVGGIPIAAGYAFALLSLAAAGTAMPSDWIWKLIPGATIIFLTGLVDDFINLSPRVKLLGEIVAALSVFAAGLRLQALGGYVLPDWLSLVLTIFWLLLTTNAQNLIDGLDGLCTGMGFFATATFVCAGIIQVNPALVFLALPLGAALLGFLFFNFNPATVFLGDSGALTIGFILGCFGLVWTEQGLGFFGSLVPVLAMVIPLTDLGLSIVRRSLRGKPIFSADRGHMHHRLLDKGLSVRRSAVTLYAIGVVATGFAVLVSYPGARFFHGLVVAGFMIAGWAGISQLRYPEFKVTRKLLFGGGWRAAFDSSLALENCKVSLEKASSEEEWWDALVVNARQQGWRFLEWTGHTPERRASLQTGDIDSPFPEEIDGCWSFRIPLGGREFIEVTGCPVATDGAGKPPSLDMSALAGILRTTLASKRLQPTLP